MEENAESCAGLSEQLCFARINGGIFRLPTQLIIRLSGPDAFRYLNGQITRDLNRLGAEESASACILTPKGKLCAPLLIRRDRDDLLVEADPSLQEALVARLERYIVADDVTLSVDSPDEVFHCFGGAASECQGIRVSRLGVDGADLKSCYQGPLIDARVIETLRIERGIPAWGREMNGDTLPPEVGLDRTHIDYDRGCYPGQETISRLKSIGRVRRLLHTLSSSPGSFLRAGMSVVDEENKAIGVISSASEQFDTGSWVALAILPRETQTALFAHDPLTGERTPISITQVHGS